MFTPNRLRRSPRTDTSYASSCSSSSSSDFSTYDLVGLAARWGRAEAAATAAVPEGRGGAVLLLLVLFVLFDGRQHGALVRELCVVLRHDDATQVEGRDGRRLRSPGLWVQKWGDAAPLGSHQAGRSSRHRRPSEAVISIGAWPRRSCRPAHERGRRALCRRHRRRRRCHHRRSR